VEQGEGAVRVGEDADGAGTSDLEVVGVAELGELVGDAGHGGVEGDRVGGVEDHHDVGGGRGVAG